MRRNTRLTAVAAISVLLLATACGSSSKSKSAPTTASSSGSPATSGAATGAPLKVGIICTCSGTFGAGFQVGEDTYKSWVNTVNATGGLSGHPVQLVTEDDAAVPGTSVTDVQTLIADKVDAILDLSIVDQPWEAAVKTAGIPVVGGNVTEPPYYTNSDFYPEGQTEDTATAGFVTEAKSAGASRVAYFYCTEAPSCAEQASTIAGEAQKIGGVAVTYKAAISATAPNYTAQCVAAKQMGVDAILNGDADAVFQRAAADCSQQGFHPIYISSGESFDPSMLTATGVKDSAYYFSNDLPFFDQVPQVKAMDAAVNKYYPGNVNKDQVWTGGSSTEIWASGLLLADAVKASGIGPSGTPSPAAIVQGLDALHGDTLDGLAPPLTYHAGQPTSVGCWFSFKVTNGTPTMTNGGNVTCSSGS